jgi:uncharacterized protein
MEVINNTYQGANHRYHTYQLVIPESYNGTLLLFIHGFMGFMDWGAWRIMMDELASLGYGTCRFNLTHNGTTPEDPINFVDLEAFGKDSYYKELVDVQAMIDEVYQQVEKLDRLVLIGHSRGGGLALLAAKDKRVSALVSLAGISTIAERFPKGEELEKWRIENVRYVKNGRTGQNLPQYFVQYTEFLEHEEELSIERSCKALSKPVLLIHGIADQSVPFSEAQALQSWLKCDLFALEGSDHTFGAAHPWENQDLPVDLKVITTEIHAFLQK